MKSSCLSIEKPQSSNRSARSQNAQAYQIKTNTSHKRHCRASGFVQEPILLKNSCLIGLRSADSIP